VFDWRRLLDVAEQLVAEHPHDEAAARSAISRAYYAAFGECRRALADAQRIEPDVRDAHRQVRELFGFGQRRAEKEIALDLRRLFTQRVRADYEADPAMTVADARLAIVRARSILAARDTLPY
jgi:uncharacterized protein (UPF0332 family)